MEFSHLPVMPGEVVDLLGCGRRPGGVYVDGTAGGGGHTAEILRANGTARVIGMDRDEEAVAAASRYLKDYGERLTIVKGNFSDIRETLSGMGIGPVDGVLLDLGVSSYQLESPGRGFSFRFEARLDMRMDKSQKGSAYDLINGLDADGLARIFREYGEEREAGRIARLIVKRRESRPVETTGELVRIVLDAVPKRFQSKAIHPATRVFQALRIAVNDELVNLKKGLDGGAGSLCSGGRMAVISFHSLEDRIVKDKFRELSTGCVCPPRAPQCVCGRTPAFRLLTKRAVMPSDEEVDRNPRARSAKLRAVEKI